MAFANASVTARRRSSMRGVGSLDPVSAIRVTMARTIDRNSGRAGTSSLMWSAMPSPALLLCTPDGLVDGVEEVEGAVEPGDLEHLAHPGLRTDDADVAALAASPLERTDEYAEGCRVEKADVVEIDDQLLRVVGQEAVEAFA